MQMASPKSPAAEQAIQFIEKIRPLVFEYISRRTLPIFVGQNQDYKVLGTGLLFRVADSAFLLSAAHVFDLIGSCMKQGAPIFLSPGAGNVPLIYLNAISC